MMEWAGEPIYDRHTFCLFLRHPERRRKPQSKDQTRVLFPKQGQLSYSFAASCLISGDTSRV